MTTGWWHMIVSGYALTALSGHQSWGYVTHACTGSLYLEGMQMNEDCLWCLADSEFMTCNSRFPLCLFCDVKTRWHFPQAFEMVARVTWQTLFLGGMQW